MWEKLEQINKRYEELVAQMSNQEIATDHVQMTKPL
jgi:protein subunit release factor A